ncbi:MAG: hypothetical protein NTW14_04195 [bacterium]|nr:hypothetical protein [bacterium]
MKEDQNMTSSQTIQFRDSNGTPVQIVLFLSESKGESGVQASIDFLTTGYEQPSQLSLHFIEVGIDSATLNLEKALLDFAKDRLLIGELENDESFLFIPPNPEQFLAAKGFYLENHTLHYKRAIEALAKEREIARRVILEYAYKSESRTFKLLELEDETNYHFPGYIISEQIDILRDLGFFSNQIDGLDQGAAKLLRLTAQGMKYYEESELPANNMVFIIAPCAKKYKKIVALYEKTLKEEFRLECVPQEKSTTRKDTIRDDILSKIRSCKFIIADITGKGRIKNSKGKPEFERFNSNCIYELGYAHALNKKLICFVSKQMGSQKNELKLPFDFSSVQFDTWELNKLTEFEEILIRRIKDVLDQLQRESWPE